MQRSAPSWWAQAVQNRLIALVLAMIVLVPLAASPADLRFAGTAALVLEGFSIVLLATLLWRAKWNLTREGVVSFLKTGANLPVLAFLGLAVASCVLSPDKGYSIQETLKIGAGVLLYFVAAYHFRRSEYLSKLVDTLLFVAIAACVAGFVQFGMGEEQRASGLFGNAQLFASFLVILLPMVAMVALTEKTPNRQLAAQVATVMMAAGILLSQTRSAWSAAAAGLGALGLFALVSAVRNRKGSMATRKHELVLPVMMVGMAIAFFLIISPQTGEFLNRGNTLSNLSGINTWQTRQNWYRGAAEMIRQHPLIGVGVGRYPVVQEQFTGMGRPAGLQSIHGQVGATLSETAHNFWLQTAAELGIPGAALMALALIVFWFSGFRRALKMDTGIRRSLLIGAMASMVAFSVDSIASPSWQFGQTAMFFWLTLGIGVGCLRPISKSREEAVAPVASAVRFLRPSTAFAALALVGLLINTVAFAGGGGSYVHPIRAVLTPKNATIRGGQIETYTLMVLFGDGAGHSEWFDVSLDAKTKFSHLGGKGAMAGPNHRAYQSRLGENDKPVIKGVYNQKVKGDPIVSDTANLFVKYP